MSDNPADSLRRELEAALENSVVPARSSADIVNTIWPLVEAARADERERIEAWFDDRFPTGLYGDEVIISRAEFKAAVKDEK